MGLQLSQGSFAPRVGDKRRDARRPPRARLAEAAVPLEVVAVLEPRLQLAQHVRRRLRFDSAGQPLDVTRQFEQRLGQPCRGGGHGGVADSLARRHPILDHRQPNPLCHLLGDITLGLEVDPGPRLAEALGRRRIQGAAGGHDSLRPADGAVVQQQPDFRPLIERDAALQAVGRAGFDEALFNVGRLGVEAHEDGDLVRRDALGQVGPDLFHQRPRHRLLGRRLVNPRQPAEPLRQAQPLGLPHAVMLDDAVRQDHLRRLAAEAVGHVVGLGPVAAGEVEDEARVRAAPLVDRLVVVANGHVVAVGRGQQVEHFGLGEVDVLELIHHNAVVLASDRLQQVRGLDHDLPAGHEHVIEGVRTLAPPYLLHEPIEVQIPGQAVWRGGLRRQA